MPVADMPPQMQETIYCSIAAAIKYSVPANIVLSIAEKESGTPGEWIKNSNGSYDIGYMQFNTSYLSDIEKYGINTTDVAAPGCFSFDLAAWRIRGHIKNDQGDIWTKAANYHSRTYEYNTVYRADLIVKAEKWANWLRANMSINELKKSTTKQNEKLTAQQVLNEARKIEEKYASKEND